MTRPRRRRTPGVGGLEPRCLLTVPAPVPVAVWIGQDDHDLAGPSSTLGPDGVQDIHIELTNLPTNLQIVGVDVRPYGSGEWTYNGVGNHWALAVVRAPGSATADLYMDPYQVETGRPYQIDLTYDDQSTVEVWLNGGTADPNLRMPADAVAAAWLGQDGHDLTGPGPDVGPDGIQDAHVALSNLFPGSPLTSVTVTAPSGAAWTFGDNPSLNGNAELVTNSADPTRADLYFSPGADLNGQTLTLSLTYANGKTDGTTIVAGPTDPALAMPAPAAAVALTWNTFAVSWLGQDGQNLTGAGAVHLALTGLPAGRSVVSATLDRRGEGHVVSTAPTAHQARGRPVRRAAGLPRRHRPDPGGRRLPADPRRDGRDPDPPAGARRRDEPGDSLRGRGERRRPARAGNRRDVGHGRTRATT